MADDEKTIDDETPAPEPEPEAASAEPAAAEEPAAEEPAADEASPAAEATAAPEAAEPEIPAKPRRSRRHVPRAERRTRTKPKRETSAKRKPLTRTEKPEHDRGRRQERRGVVISDKADKTIVVKVDVIKSHPKYKKVVRRSVKFHAHDETNSAGIGDTVRIVETRPLSKQKRWRLAEIVEKAR
jgi:small subunit ribosomal protein S17